MRLHEIDSMVDKATDASAERRINCIENTVWRGVERCIEGFTNVRVRIAVWAGANSLPLARTADETVTNEIVSRSLLELPSLTP